MPAVTFFRPSPNRAPRTAMKILHLIDIPWWSGLASYALDCMSAQAEMGHKVFLLCEKKSLSSRRAALIGFPFSTIGGRYFWRAPGNFIRIGLRLILKRPQVIVAHTGSTHWIAVFWGRLLGIPVVRTRAISRRIKSGVIGRLVYRNTSCVVAASERLKEECIGHLPIKWNGKIRVLLPPVENPRLETPGPFKAQVPQNYRIGVLARLDPKKGHFKILESFRKLQSKE